MEQILINYTKTESDFLLSIITDEQVICYNEETPEADEIVNKIKELI